MSPDTMSPEERALFALTAIEALSTELAAACVEGHAIDVRQTDELIAKLQEFLGDCQKYSSSSLIIALASCMKSVSRHILDKAASIASKMNASKLN